MDLQWRDGASASRFGIYMERLTRALGHADRVAPFQAYCVGLMLPGQRKSVEPMAARVEPARVGAAHQSLHHFVAQAAWDDGAVLAAVRDMVLPAMEAQAPIQAWIIDDTGMPKKGRHSVGVGRQYCGQVGKQENCQVAVSLSVATDQASLPVAFRLYLPEAWADDPERRAKAGIPGEIAFQTKPQIALAQIRAAIAADVPRGVVVMDAGYGADGELRAGITELGLAYVAGVQSSVSVWPPGTTPLPPKPWSGRGRPPKLIHGPQAGLGQGLGQGAAGSGLADCDLARGHQDVTHVALCGRARPTGPPRLLARTALARGVAAYGVAGR